MAVSVTDIGENTKLAREMSLLGNYETARNILKLSEPSLFLENQSCHLLIIPRDLSFEVVSQCLLPRHRSTNPPSPGHYRGPSEKVEVAADPGRDSGGAGRGEEHHDEPQHLETGQPGEPSRWEQELLLRRAYTRRELLCSEGETCCLCQTSHTSRNWSQSDVALHLLCLCREIQTVTISA